MLLILRWCTFCSLLEMTSAVSTLLNISYPGILVASVVKSCLLNTKTWWQSMALTGFWGKAPTYSNWLLDQDNATPNYCSAYTLNWTIPVHILINSRDQIRTFLQTFFQIRKKKLKTISAYCSFVLGRTRGNCSRNCQEALCQFLLLTWRATRQLPSL